MGIRVLRGITILRWSNCKDDKRRLDCAGKIPLNPPFSKGESYFDRFPSLKRGVRGDLKLIELGTLGIGRNLRMAQLPVERLPSAESGRNIAFVDPSHSR